MSAPPSCESTFTAWTGLTLRCTGDHLRGNIMRGEVHQQRYAGIVWTWYSDEADRPVTKHGTVAS